MSEEAVPKRMASFYFWSWLWPFALIPDLTIGFVKVCEAEGPRLGNSNSLGVGNAEGPK